MSDHKTLFGFSIVEGEIAGGECDIAAIQLVGCDGYIIPAVHLQEGDHVLVTINSHVTYKARVVKITEAME